MSIIEKLEIYASLVFIGGNWGYDIPAQHKQFAYTLIDELGINVIHGHSSHHPMGIEWHNQGLILYGYVLSSIATKIL